MRALEPEVANAVWEAVEALIPSREDNHPMGGHRPRIPDRVCLLGILIRLVVGECRTPAGQSGVGHHTAGPTRRMDRCGGVRCSGVRGAGGL